eukprot:1157877-Pelagomonas_calceolata.AAC.6
MRIQGPASVAAPMNLALLGGGSAHTAAGVSASGLQSLRDHADRMMQQQRADAKNKGQCGGIAASCASRNCAFQHQLLLPAGLPFPSLLWHVKHHTLKHII